MPRNPGPQDVVEPLEIVQIITVFNNTGLPCEICLKNKGKYFSERWTFSVVYIYQLISGSIFPTLQLNILLFQGKALNKFFLYSQKARRSLINFSLGKEETT